MAEQAVAAPTNSDLHRIGSNCGVRSRWRAFLSMALLLSLTVANAAGMAQDAADAPQSLTPISLTPIEVTAPRLKRDWLTFPAPVAVIGKQTVQQGRQMLQLDQALSRVPGVFARNSTNFSQDLRVSIRGFGARSPWGIRGIQVLVDGIPATLTDGQSQVDVIDLGTIQRIEVLRGPFSALYGNATGGVIDIVTQTPDRDGNYAFEASVGSNGYSRASATAGKQYDQWGYIATITDLQLDGYREHSSVHKQLLTAKANVEIGTTGKLRFITRMLDAPSTEDPGGVTLQRAQTRPESARPANIHYDSRQSATQQTVGLVYTDQISTQQDYKARLFYTNRDYIQYLPYPDGAVVTYDRTYYGGGLQTTRDGQMFDMDVQWVAGTDFSVQNDDRQRYNNIAGEKGKRVFNEDQTATSVGVFLQSVWAPSDRLEITTGLRYDWLEFDIDDRYMTATNPDDSGRRSYTELSGNLGASYAWRPKQHVYANVATAFESPTFTEFANPTGQGGFNPGIEPQTAINYEIGAKGVLGERARYQISAFWINTEDELVVYQSGGGRDFYENSGETRRRGIEASMEYFFTDHLTATVSYTYAEYEFVEFTNRKGQDFSGNRLPGLPQQTLFAELAWQKEDVGFAAISALWVDERYADNANEVQVPSYSVVNARVGKVFHPGGQKLTVYGGVNNLLDEFYFSNIRINAYGGRYYEPAPGRTVYVGLKLAL